ncbi:hypothetical protein O181_051739 [Austropuccinia psidii MF-1]|uniref:Zinc finger C2H2 LYAR-type domain-containing protein n=1 Tax=Austropuccinia psidii MF-1 TaxID=1389203 RepID=A0A9Q3DZD6_9BASI|nr:hypothetical protein [Austropuccinia psidii MF-1]
MPSFNCDGCGDVIKKPKLDSHSFKCRASMTCLDCSTTFNDSASWKLHTSCISEAQKYQKSLYKDPKAKKQENQTKPKFNQAKPVQLEAGLPSSAPTVNHVTHITKADEEKTQPTQALITSTTTVASVVKSEDNPNKGKKKNQKKSRLENPAESNADQNSINLDFVPNLPAKKVKSKSKRDSNPPKYNEVVEAINKAFSQEPRKEVQAVPAIENSAKTLDELNVAQEMTGEPLDKIIKQFKPTKAINGKSKTNLDKETKLDDPSNNKFTKKPIKTVTAQVFNMEAIEKKVKQGNTLQTINGQPTQEVKTVQPLNEKSVTKHKRKHESGEKHINESNDLQSGAHVEKHEGKRRRRKKNKLRDLSSKAPDPSLVPEAEEISKAAQGLISAADGLPMTLQEVIDGVLSSTQSQKADQNNIFSKSSLENLMMNGAIKFVSNQKSIELVWA